MQIFDTHCQYNLPPLVADWQTHWQKAQAHGVTHSTVVGVDILTSQLSVKMAQIEPRFSAIIGCHPGHYQEEVESRVSTALTEPAGKIDFQLLENELLQLIEVEKSQLEQLLMSTDSRLIKAVGEAGLDYFRLPTGEVGELIKTIQKAALRMQLNIAKEANLPIVLHVRDTGEAAYWDVWEILKQENWTGPFILHCVSGPIAYVREAIAKGAYLGMAGNMTYKNADRLRELARLAPMNQLLLETDAPFLPPQPFRGQTCEPWMISETAQYVEKNLSLDLAQIYQNSVTVFQFPQK